MIKNCVDCNQKIEVHRGTAIRCPLCQKTYKSEYTKVYWKTHVDKRQRFCAICGIPFKPKLIHQRACEKENCQGLWEEEKINKANKKKKASYKIRQEDKRIARFMPKSGIWVALMRG